MLKLDAMSLFNRIGSIGAGETGDYDTRYIVIANRVSLLISVLLCVIFLAALSYFGWLTAVKLSLVFLFVSLLPILLNALGLNYASRVFAAVMLCLGATVISIFDKVEIAQLEEFQYFEFRVVILCASQLPFILFRLEERRLWISTLVFNLTLLVFYDPIHEFFHVGYYQLGFTGPNYEFQNFIFVTCFAILAACAYFLKRSFENYENKNEKLISELSVKHQEMAVANQSIERSSKILTSENFNLNKELIEKNNQLVETNEELIRHNNDLQQFSYTVSHNLRGPVASLLGLMTLVDKKSIQGENLVLLGHLQKVVNTLDTTIRDLSNIIDIRNSNSKVKQRINLKDEIEQNSNLLEKSIKENEATIEIDVTDCPEIYSVKAMVNSIFYNLISNSIKYHSEDRKPVIKIRSRRIDSFIEIQVQDNGIGIDLEKFREKLFGLYKRFHTHVEGKGLGLFLVKLQTESLGGKVKIESTVGFGSTFYISIPDTTNPDHQIIMDKEWGKLYFDAMINTTYVIWKRPLHVHEFKEFFQRCVEFNNVQQCANWIAEIKKGTKADDNNEEYNRVRMAFANELKRTPLKRLAYVISKENEPDDFELYKQQLIAFYQGKIQFYSNVEDAQAWILAENYKDKMKNVSALN